ncbi:hypothetical protein M0R45_018797 [Rubus argutus]|uniref:Uncharacterized protein n=1 Tax=Rubus argutus TaxID=59490 RepID=A0AAW1X3Q2_RUBAR
MMKMVGLRLLVILVFSLILTSASASNINTTIITTLPGYSGELPFTLETGYVGVGDNEEVQLFYYFIESQRNPGQDPLVLWLGAGPGCSGLAGVFFQSGPLSFKYVDYNGSLPTLQDNPFAWTQGLNIIYLDAPVGTGFSYSTTQSGYVTNDYKYVAQTYEFLQKWLDAHPAFVENLLYIGGDSYSGMIVPMVVKQIVDGNENGTVPLMNLKGYVLASPVTDSVIDVNSQIPFAHRLSLISDQLYKAAKTSCNGEYVNVDSNNAACIADIDAIERLVSDINAFQILEPVCSNSLPTPKEIGTSGIYHKDLSRGLLSAAPKGAALWCRGYIYELSYIWANSRGVQDALGVRRGTKTYWPYCNSTLAFTEDVTSVVSYHQSLSKRADLRALIYSGDHDMAIPHIGTQEWINLLNLTVDEYWRTWSLDGQTAGYTKKLINEFFSLTFATVKGAGHIPGEYKIKECAAMIDRWMAYYPL